MIEWKKYDPNKPPTSGEEYLVSNGVEVDVGRYSTSFGNKYWDVEQTWSVSPIGTVTHYAEINLPEGSQ